MDEYNKNEVMLSVLSLTQKKIDEAYALGRKEAQAGIDKRIELNRKLVPALQTELADALDEIIIKDALIAELQAELNEALSIINRFANFDIYNERADALHMVAVRFLDKHSYKGE